MRQVNYYLAAISLLGILSCQEPDHSKEIENVQIATSTLRFQCQRMFSEMENSVVEKGSRASDVAVLETAKEILGKVANAESDDTQQLINELQEYLKNEAELLDEISPHLDRLNYFANRIKAINEEMPVSLAAANWELSNVFIQDDLLQHYAEKLGAQDLTFSSGINAATNFNDASIGKPTSVVLQGTFPGSKISNIHVMVDQEEVEAEVTEMNDIVLVNFTPTKKGKYSVKFDSHLSTYDTTGVSTSAISINELSGKAN